nr:hypothetical protein Q903MT_gene898 [Picea sitchensis]
MAGMPVVRNIDLELEKMLHLHLGILVATQATFHPACLW